MFFGALLNLQNDTLCPVCTTFDVCEPQAVFLVWLVAMAVKIHYDVKRHITNSGFIY